MPAIRTAIDVQRVCHLRLVLFRCRYQGVRGWCRRQVQHALQCNGTAQPTLGPFVIMRKHYVPQIVLTKGLWRSTRTRSSSYEPWSRGLAVMLRNIESSRNSTACSTIGGENTISPSFTSSHFGDAPSPAGRWEYFISPLFTYMKCESVLW